MKQFLPLLQGTIKHIGYFQSFCAREQELLQAIEQKNGVIQQRRCQWLIFHVIVIFVSVMVFSAAIVEVFNNVFVGYFSGFSLLGSIMMLLHLMDDPQTAIHKEHQALEALEQELVNDLTANHALAQDLMQCVVDSRTQTIFTDIAAHLHQKDKSPISGKITALFEAYMDVQQQNEKFIHDQEALKALGVNVGVDAPKPCVKDRDKLVALL